MSKSKSTRSSKIKDDPDANRKIIKAPALRKVFYVTQEMLDAGVNEMKLERFYHPGKGKQTFFITTISDKQKPIIMEVLEFAEPRRSWLINQDVCSNGKLYLTTPVDVTFLALYHMKKHCSQRALALDTISDDQDESAARLLMGYVDVNQLKCIADIKTAGNDKYFKYNAEKALAWLALKTRRTADALLRNGVNCGFSSLSQNYAKSEVLSSECEVKDMEYLRKACDLVGSYVDQDLHEELTQYLAINTQMEENKEVNDQTNKRKSLQTLKGAEKKKLKLEGNENASDKLKNGGLLDSSVDEPVRKSESEQVASKPTPLKERPLTAKEKALAKGAKGSKSIASFFKR